jgi:FMN phosphatase YigB (HAD superfamily)
VTKEGLLTRGRIQGVAFDCFGTLVEVTEPRDVHRTISRIVGGRMDPSPMVRDWKIVDIVRRAAPHASTDDLDRLQADIDAEIASIRFIAGAMETYETFSRSGFDIILASNLASDYAEPLWDMLDTEFRCLSCVMETVKPEPPFFHDLINHFCWPIEELLMVGDSYRSDYLGAKAAGMQAVLIGATDVPGVEAVPDISALPEWFETRWGSTESGA